MTPEAASLKALSASLMWVLTVLIRQAMYDADFYLVEETDRGYNQPAYDTATRTYTVFWTWVCYDEVM